MAKKFLPVFEDPAEERSAPAKKKPSIDVARSRLGGRIGQVDVAPGLSPGVPVTFGHNGRRIPCVVVFASSSEVHVLIDAIRLRRLPPEELELHPGQLPVELDKIAGDARLFGRLVEGQSVRYADEAGTLIDGKVFEKCRWGALVLRDDGAIVAVGFRKLWPAPTAAGGPA